MGSEIVYKRQARKISYGFVETWFKRACLWCVSTSKYWLENRHDACYQHDGIVGNYTHKDAVGTALFLRDEVLLENNYPQDDVSEAHCFFTAKDNSPTMISPLSVTSSGDRRYIMDTGTAEHIEGEDMESLKDFKTHKLNSKIRLAAAGGVLEVDTAICRPSPTLGVDLDRLCVPGSPLASSIGKLCIEHGFAFWWPWGSYRPVLINTDGVEIPFEVENFVPFLTEYGERCLAYPQMSLSALLPAPAGKEPSQKEQDLRAAATSKEHLLLHLPKNPFCDTCNRAKARACTHRKQNPETTTTATLTAFGEWLTGDHLILYSDDDMGVNNETTGLLIMDAFTKFLGFYPNTSREAEEHIISMKEFVGTDRVGQFYSDGSCELNAAATALKWLHPTGRPHQPQTNCKIEGQVGLLKPAVRCSLLQAGLRYKWWPLACAHYTMTRNIVLDPMSPPDPREKTPWERRFGTPFIGQVHPFGALVRYRPYGPQLKALPAFHPGTLEGLFLGWRLHPCLLYTSPSPRDLSTSRMPSSA